MLTPEQIEALGEYATQITDPVTDFLIRDIAKRVKEAGQLTSTAAYQAWNAQRLGISQKELKKKLQKILNKSESEIEALLTQCAEVGYRFDLDRFPTIEAIPFVENTTVQNIVNATIQMAGTELQNLTRTIGFVGPDGVCRELTQAYNQACDFAFQKVSTGAQDYMSAIREATRNLAEKGIRTIDYESGVQCSIEAATRRSVMGGLGLMQEQISEQNFIDMGCDGWEISAHAASAEDHAPFQGRQYTDKEYKALNNSLVRRIGQLNCGHSSFPIILGVNAPQYTPEELEQMRKDNETGVTYNGKHYTLYECTQRQRALERSIRKQKRRILIDEATGDKEKLQTDQIRLQVIKQEYARFSKRTGLPMQHQRAEVAGFTFKDGKAAEKVAKRAKLSQKTVAKEEERGIIHTGRSMASGARKSFLVKLSDDDKKFVMQEAQAIGIEPGVIQFRDFQPTSYSDKRDIVFFSSSVFPSEDGSTHPTDMLSVRATLAHEYYGHRAHRNTRAKKGSWNDEFRASYTAARDCPGLSQEERVQLINDAMQRAKDAGVNIRLNSYMKRCLYGIE